MRSRATVWAWVSGLGATVVATAVVTAGIWGRGVLLYRDDVQVPHPVWGEAALGLTQGPPRAVPYAGVLAGLSQVLGAPAAQRLVLVAPLLLAGAGVTALLARRGASACVVAAWFAVWNPYVAERLGLGQAPTLLAYGTLAWVVVAVRWSRGHGPTTTAAACVLAVAPAALTPVGWLLAMVVLVVSLVAPGRCLRERLAGVTGPALLCLPWAFAALASGAVAATADGAAAFAARDDTGGGLLVSVATSGGVWAPSATPASRAHTVSVVLGLLLLLVATTGWATAAGRRWLAVTAWLLPVAGVVLAATGPGVRLLAALQAVPGVALLRDTHRLLAPAVLVVALGLGLAAGAVRVPVPRAGAAVAVVAVSVLALPDLPGAFAHRYRPVVVPADWQAAVATVSASGRGVLSMPWQPLRRTAWNGGRPFLDPVDRAVVGPVLVSHRLQVVRDGRVLVTDVDTESSAGEWAAGRVDPAWLARQGVGWVFETRGTPGAPVPATAGLTLVQDGPAVRLWRVDAAVDPAPARRQAWEQGIGWVVAAAALLLAVARLLLKRRSDHADEGLRKSATSR